MSARADERFGARIHGGWTGINCGCCSGIQWGGEYPRTCNICEGSGGLWLSPSGTRLALYPGGPFAGAADDGDRRQAATYRASRRLFAERADRPGGGPARDTT